MINISCRFAHSFKIMCIPQPGLADVFLPRTSQAICSGGGYKIDIAYIRCIDGREPKDFELWVFSEDVICKVHPFARLQIRDDFTEDTFYTDFFNARQIQIPFLVCRTVNGSVQWIDDLCAALQDGSFCQVANWTENTFVYLGDLIQLVFRRMFLLSGDVQLMMFLLTPTLFHCEPRGSSTLEFSRTSVTGPMIPPMTTAGLKSPTLTDKVQTLSKM